jgi:hypothetical protein
LTHSLEAPGFNPYTFKVICRFQAVAFHKCNLYRYISEASGEGEVGEQLQMARASRGITLGALPLSRFCSGHIFFVQRLPVALGVKPLVVHTTYQFSQARGKRQRWGCTT